jgi:hypothetical protein
VGVVVTSAIAKLVSSGRAAMPASSEIACPNCRRAHARTPKNAGDSAGAVGEPPASGLTPAHANSLETNPLTTVVGFGVGDVAVTIGDASDEAFGVTDSAVTPCVGPAGTGVALSGWPDEPIATKVVFIGVWDPDPVRTGVVIAPSELRTILLREPAGVFESDSFVTVFAPPEARTMPESTSCTIAEAVTGNVWDGPGLGAEPGVDEAVPEPVSANAAPVAPVTPNPTPKATARAPTRPMLRAHTIVTTPPLRCACEQRRTTGA